MKLALRSLKTIAVTNNNRIGADMFRQFRLSRISCFRITQPEFNNSPSRSGLILTASSVPRIVSSGHTANRQEGR